MWMEGGGGGCWCCRREFPLRGRKEVPERACSKRGSQSAQFRCQFSPLHVNGTRRRGLLLPLQSERVSFARTCRRQQTRVASPQLLTSTPSTLIHSLVPECWLGEWKWLSSTHTRGRRTSLRTGSVTSLRYPSSCSPASVVSTPIEATIAAIHRSVSGGRALQSGWTMDSVVQRVLSRANCKAGSD